MFCYFVGVLSIFILSENISCELQTNNRNLKITLESKIALVVQKKLGLLA